MPQNLHYVLEVLRIFIWREAIFEWTRLFEHLINLMELKKKYNTKIKIPITVCPRSLDPFNIVDYHIQWVWTSWAYRTLPHSFASD